MSLSVLTNVNMNGNSVLNPVLNPLATAPEHANPYYIYTNTVDHTVYQNVGTYAEPVWNPIGRAPTAGQGIEVDGFEVSLPDVFYDYLVAQTFDYPSITAFSITGLGGAAEIGTSINVSGFNHTEKNINNINGKLTLKMGSTTLASNVNPSATSATGSFTQQTVTMSSAGAVTFTLSGVDKLGGSFNKTASKSFYVPKFIGSNANTSVTSAQILTMSKGQNQPTTITLSSDGYIYFVTNGTINAVKDSTTGFGVPIEAAVVQTVSINGVNVNYNVYRTTNKIVVGSYSFTIS